MVTAASGSMEVLIPVVIMFLIFLMIALGIALTVFWVLMIIDCAKRKNLTDSERVVWILILVFLGVLGALIYYFAVKRQGVGH